jgi:hypothetical protein
VRSGWVARMRAATRSSASSQRDPPEPRLAAPPQEREGDPPEGAQVATGQRAQRRRVGQAGGVELADRVEAQQPEPHVAQVDAVDGPVAHAVRAERAAVAVPVIGFSGAPFTLASYLIEGKPSKEFAVTRELMFSDADTWHALMDRLTDMVIEYLDVQIDAGAQALQLFDSWIGVLAEPEVRAYVLPYTKRVFEAIAGRGIPTIHFGTGTSHLLELMAEPACDAVSVDWRVPLGEAWDRIGHGKGIQGNLDPAVLCGPPELVVERATEVLDHAAGRPGTCSTSDTASCPAPGSTTSSCWSTRSTSAGGRDDRRAVHGLRQPPQPG